MTAITPYDHKVSPTVAATQFAAALAAREDLVDFETGQPIKARNWGQGADPTPLVPELAELMSGKIVSSGVYGPAVKPLNEAAAAFYRRMTGVQATKDNTLVGQLLGRAPMYMAATNMLRAQIPNAAIIAPNTSWPMISEIFEGFQFLLYDPSWPPTQIAAFIDDACNRTGPDAPVPVFVYTNPPHNPTGANLIEFQPILDVTDRINSDPEQLAKRGRDLNGAFVQRKLTLYVDNAYYLVSPIRTRVLRSENDSYLETGLEGLDPKGVTPWVVGFSGSKALGSAQPGLFFAVCSDNMVAAMTKEHAILSSRQAGSADYLNNVAKALASENDGLWLDRFAERTGVYTQNRESLKAVFGDAVVQGDANLVGLMKFPKRTFINKVITVHGQDFDFDRVSDVVHAIGNMVGITLVDNGFHPDTGDVLLRVAFPSNPADFSQGVPELKRAIDYIRQQP